MRWHGSKSWWPFRGLYECGYLTSWQFQNVDLVGEPNRNVEMELDCFAFIHLELLVFSVSQCRVFFNRLENICLCSHLTARMRKIMWVFEILKLMYNFIKLITIVTTKVDDFPLQTRILVEGPADIQIVAAFSCVWMLRFTIQYMKVERLRANDGGLWGREVPSILVRVSPLICYLT